MTCSPNLSGTGLSDYFAHDAGGCINAATLLFDSTKPTGPNKAAVGRGEEWGGARMWWIWQQWNALDPIPSIQRRSASFFSSEVRQLAWLQETPLASKRLTEQ